MEHEFDFKRNSWLVEFKEYLVLSEKSEATIEKYISAVEELFKWAETEYGSSNLTKGTLLNYRQYLLQHHKPRTVNGKLSAINCYLKYINKEYIKVNFVKVQRSSFTDDNRELTEAEYKRLLAAAHSKGNERLYLIMMTLCSTGIRISELKYITVEAVRQGRATVNNKGKCRVILLSKDLCKKLKSYANRHSIDSGYIFRTKTGKPVDRTNIFHDMKKLCKSAKVDKRKVFPHNFRHLFRRKFYEIEKNLAHLADVLGHSRIETTRIYVATTAATHQKILNKMKLVI